MLCAMDVHDDLAWDRTIICHPSVEPKLSAALEMMPPIPRHRVLARSLCRQDQLFISDDEWMERVLELPLTLEVRQPVLSERAWLATLAEQRLSFAVRRPTSFIHVGVTA